MWYHIPFYSLNREGNPLDPTNEQKKKSFSDNMRVWFRWYYHPIAEFFNRLGIRPNTVTLIGMTGTMVVCLIDC